MKNSEIKKLVAELENHAVECKEFNKIYFADLKDAELASDASFVEDAELCIEISTNAIFTIKNAVRAAEVLKKLMAKIKNVALWSPTIDTILLDSLTARKKRLEKILSARIEKAEKEFKKFINLAYDCFFYKIQGEEYFLAASLKDYTCI